MDNSVLSSWYSGTVKHKLQA